MSALIRRSRFDKKTLILSAGLEYRTASNTPAPPSTTIVPRELSPPHEEMPTYQDSGADVRLSLDSSVAATRLSGVEYTEGFQRERESARAEGREQGYREGYETGKREGYAVFEEQITRLNSIVDSVNTSLMQGIDGIEDVTVEVVFSAVCKILGTTLMDRSAVAAIVRRVVDQVKEQEKAVIRVTPSDYEFLKSLDPAWLPVGLQNGALVPDERVVLGGCLLETSGGNVDGRLEIQLALLRDTLVQARARRVEREIETTP